MRYKQKKCTTVFFIIYVVFVIICVLPVTIHKTKADDKIKKDVLLEIKNDPFSNDSFSKEDKLNKKEQGGKVKIKKEEIKDANPIQRIKISGIAIYKNQKTAIIEIEGETFFVTEGDEIRNIKILKIDRNYIELRINGELNSKYRLSY